MANYGSGTYSLLSLGGTVTATVDPDSAVTFNLIGVLGTFDISANIGSSVVINNTVNAASTLNLDTDGGAISIGTLASVIGPVHATIDKGGTFTAGGTVVGLLNSGTISYSTGGGTAILGTASDFINLSFAPEFTNFTNPSDVIDDRSLSSNGFQSYTVSGTGPVQTITVADTAGDFTFTTVGANLAVGTFVSKTGGPLTFSADGSGGTDITAVCFLRGTQIGTPEGETAVEVLQAGDLVATRLNGDTVFCPVTWVGRRSMDVARAGGEMEAYPVRIRASAFSENVPHRDLLVTSEHCIFVDGKLVPVRMLVNGGSIMVDTSITEYEYFHLELDSHSILVSEGLETESYLDTGNRGNFANGLATLLRSDFTVDAAHKSWKTDAAAPLAVDRETVEPIWQRLTERSRQLGLTADNTLGELLSEPDLHLITDGGLEIRPSMLDGKIYSFVVPGGTRVLRLASRASRPSDIVGPYLDDRRKLGVLIGRISLRVGRRRIVEDRHLSATLLGGWHAPEPGSSFRWTSGNAILPLDLSVLQGRPAFLDIEVIHAGPYLAAVTATSLAA